MNDIILKYYPKTSVNIRKKDACNAWKFSCEINEICLGINKTFFELFALSFMLKLLIN